MCGIGDRYIGAETDVESAAKNKRNERLEQLDTRHTNENEKRLYITTTK